MEDKPKENGEKVVEAPVQEAPATEEKKTEAVTDAKPQEDSAMLQTTEEAVQPNQEVIEKVDDKPVEGENVNSSLPANSKKRSLE